MPCLSLSLPSGSIHIGNVNQKSVEKMATSWTYVGSGPLTVGNNDNEVYPSGPTSGSVMGDLWILQIQTASGTRVPSIDSDFPTIANWDNNGVKHAIAYWWTQ